MPEPRRRARLSEQTTTRTNVAPVVRNTAPRTPADTAARLSVQERMLLFCLASGTDWQRAGVNVGAATPLVVRNLVERDHSPARFRLTPSGVKAFAALIRVPLAGQNDAA
jgi:hypothetical protein